jgi:hypothetical protein
MVNYSEAGQAGTKKIKHGENRANREGNAWKNPFSDIISVVSVFPVLKNFVFFAQISLFGN